jgi:hypothetical protein
MSPGSKSRFDLTGDVKPKVSCETKTWETLLCHKFWSHVGLVARAKVLGEVPVQLLKARESTAVSA